MEEKKFDPWQFVGFFLIALILTWMLYNQAPVEEAAVENVNQTESAARNVPEQSNTVVVNDSLQSNQRQASYGSFTNLFQFTTTKKVDFENEKLAIKFNPKGPSPNIFMGKLHKRMITYYYSLSNSRTSSRK